LIVEGSGKPNCRNQSRLTDLLWRCRRDLEFGLTDDIWGDNFCSVVNEVGDVGVVGVTGFGFYGSLSWGDGLYGVLLYVI